MASQAFTDQHGKPWTVSITVGDFRTVKAATGVDLGGLVDEGCKPLSELLGNPVRFVGVLWELCRRQSPETTEEQFYRGLAGDCLEAAADAFVEALASFFPRRLRDLLRRMSAKGDEVKALTHAHMVSLIDQTPAESLVPAALRNSAGGSPASSGATPAG